MASEQDLRDHIRRREDAIAAGRMIVLAMALNAIACILVILAMLYRP